MADFQLNLNINGVDTAIASVEDLEKALRTTKDEMNTLAIGSEGFNTAAANAQKLDSALKNVKLTTEGVNTKQMAKAFADLGQTVGGAFAIATNAMAVFGVKSKDVEEAQVKAQAAIAVVMGARAIAEGVVEGRIAARLILEKVSIANTALMTTLFSAEAAAAASLAVAEGEATVAQYALNVAMNANPILLVVTAIGALVGAFAFLSDSEDNELEKAAALEEAHKKEAATIDEVVKAYKSKQEIVSGKLQNEVDELKAAGASKEKVLNAELALLDRKLMTLKVIQNDSRALNDDEVKEAYKLQSQKKQLQLAYDVESAKIAKDERKKEVDERVKAAKDLDEKLKILQAAADKESLELKKALAPDKTVVLQIEQEEELKYIKKSSDDYIKAGGDKIKAEEIFQKAKLDLLSKYTILINAENDIYKEEGDKQKAEQYKKERDFYSKLNSDRSAIQLQGLNGLALLEEKHTQDKLKLESDYKEKKKEALVLLGGDAAKFAEADKQIDADNLAAKTKLEDQYRDDKLAKELAVAQKIAQIGTQYVSEAMGIANNIAAGKKQALDQELVDLDNSNIAREDSYNKDYNAKKAALDADLKNGTKTKKEYDAAIKALQKKKDDDDKAAAKKLLEEKNAIRKLEFENDKKMKTASTVINTIMGAIAAFTGMAQAIPGPYGLIAGGIAATAVTVAGAIAVANIQNTKFNEEKAPPTSVDTSAGEEAQNAVGGAGGVNAASSGGFTAFTPNASTTGGTTNNQGSGGSGQVVVNPYVRVSEITEAQRRVQIAESNSTFG